MTLLFLPNKEYAKSVPSGAFFYKFIAAFGTVALDQSDESLINFMKKPQIDFLLKTVEEVQWKKTQLGFAMRFFSLMVCSVVSLLVSGCDIQKEEEEVDYDHMVKNGEECEWNSGSDLDEKHIAGDLYPDPQEVVIQEEIDAPSKLDSTTIR